MLDSFLEDYGSPVHNGRILDLGIDEALVEVSSDFSSQLTLYTKSSQCVGCPFTKETTLTSSTNHSLKLGTNAYWSFLFSEQDDEYHWDNSRNASLCSLYDTEVGQFGVYSLNFNNNSCHMSTNREPVFIYGALLVALVFYVVLFSVWKAYSVLATKYPSFPCCGLWNNDQTSKEVDAETSVTSRPRLKSLDAFRGITIALMIFVNHGAGRYWFFQHAVWNGLYVADVVFPWFLWIMGVCIPMGLRSQLKKTVPKTQIFWAILVRSVKLFAIGIILNSIGGYSNLETYRLPGVLQRFGFAYLVTATVGLLFNKSLTTKTSDHNPGSFESIVSLLPQWTLYTLLTLAHLLIVFLVAVPGCKTGYIGAGGISNFIDGKPSPDCIGGVTRWVDIVVLGDSHIFQNPTAKSVYQASSFDPEGLLGILPSLLQVFLGIQAGSILMIYTDAKMRVKQWLGMGTVLGVVGLLLCMGDLSSGPIPVNKNLWSLSYVLITSALAYFLLTLCYVLVDVWNIWNGGPFYQTGMNSIFLYVGHFFTFGVFPWHYTYRKLNSHYAFLIETLVGTSLWVLIALYLHRKGKFYTV